MLLSKWENSLAEGLRLALSALVKHPQDIDAPISGRLKI